MLPLHPFPDIFCHDQALVLFVSLKNIMMLSIVIVRILVKPFQAALADHSEFYIFGFYLYMLKAGQGYFTTLF